MIKHSGELPVITEQLSSRMAQYQLVRTQKVPTTIGQVWDFISSPGNLKLITPPHMGFDMTTKPAGEKMYAGMIISYTVRPLFGINIRWVTEITHIREMEYFVDEQRVGPYTLWHHQHIIEPAPYGVLMTDIVTYVPPFGFLGAIANKVWIRKELESIFDFRHKALVKHFGDAT